MSDEFEEKRYIPLRVWANRLFNPAPSIRTLRVWARAGRIDPPAIIAGNQYRVREDACYVPRRVTFGVRGNNAPYSDDPVVAGILNRG